MSQLFSTDLVPVSDRLDAWLWNARQVCGNCQFQFHKHYPFHGSIDRRRVGEFESTLFSSSAVSFDKIPQVALQSEHRACIVITQVAGTRQYRQSGKVAVLKKGDTTLIDSAVPWSSQCAGDCTRLYLRIPQFVMERRLKPVPIPFVSRIPGATGLGAALFRLATSLYDQADALNQEQATVAVDAYLSLLSACLGGPATRYELDCHSVQLLDRVHRYIDENLADAALCPSKIAAALGMSVRHLHRVFSGRGVTLADWIRAQRLQHCWKDLANPRLREKSITEIAFFWGFNDSAHFSHAFKQHFGVCPRSFRSQSWVGSRTKLTMWPARPPQEDPRHAKAS